ncbi:S8 family serine peptidase [Acidobacteriota bacterium]
MKSWSNLVKIILIVSTCFACFMILFPYKSYIDEPPGNYNLPPINDDERNSHPKIESNLYRLMKVYFAQGLEEATRFALLRGIKIEGDTVKIVTEVMTVRDIDKVINGEKLPEKSNEVQEKVHIVNRYIRALGGSVETTYNNLIQSVVPIYILQNLADYPDVEYLRLPKKPYPCVISEGVAKTGANQWHSLVSYRTEDEVKVCILDAGFAEYRALLGEELPSTVQTKSFRADRDLYAHDHGTACAEIVHDMAPNAKLWLVNFGTDVEHHNAVDWIITQGINIVSYSMGWFNIGGGDGTGPICEDVKKAHDNGIIWASAAGNDATNHWEGNFKDSDIDNWHNFSGNDEILHFYVDAYTPVDIFLNWNDWGNWSGNRYRGSDQDYDLYLYYWTGTEWSYVDDSRNVQNGTQWPQEWIGGWYSKYSAYWGIAVKKYKANKNVKLEAFILGNSNPVEYNHTYGSLNIPADSPYAIAVGATDCINDSYHSYSSRGPTSDLRIKPDLCAPSGVTGHTYGDLGFYGTSAATPHVAGAFALIKGKTPFSLDRIRAILEARALDFGPTDKDNRFGLGRLNLVK